MENNMFANTDTLSFYLGISFIIMALIGLLAIGGLVLCSSIADTKLDKLIEVGKWFIVSVAIVTGASIVSDSFKEREQDVKEIEVFDKYVSTITAADGIEKRWLLAEYFSYVAPPGELRKSWEAYKNAIKPALDLYRANKEQINALLAKKGRTEDENATLKNLQKKNEVLDESLVSQGFEGAPPPDEWLIIASTDVTLQAAQDKLTKAQTLSANARIYKKGDQFLTVIRNFMSGDEALKMLPEAKQVINPDAYIVVSKNLCTSMKDSSQYMECN